MSFLKQLFGTKNNKAVDTDIVTDFDGNDYKTIRIGNQLWMASNLMVTHYRNGDPIPQVQKSDEWSKIETGAWCFYENNPENGKKYGKLYNWYAVNDNRNIAPEGWHVPSDDEWKKLEQYLFMHQADADNVGRRGKNEGGKLKETGTTHWKSPNAGATNESRFLALPGGYRISNGDFDRLRSMANFWTSTERDSLGAWDRYLMHDSATIGRYGSDKKVALSIRCVRD